MTFFAIVALIWAAVGTWLTATGRAGYDLRGIAPWYVRVFAHVSTVIIAPALYALVLITGKDI